MEPSDIPKEEMEEKIESKQKVDLIKLVKVSSHKIEICESDFNLHKEEYLEIFNECWDTENSNYIHVDNKGNFIFVSCEKKLLYINGKQRWKEFYDQVMALTGKFEEVERIILGEQMGVIYYYLREEKNELEGNVNYMCTF